MLVRWGCGLLVLLVCPRYSVAMERECVFLKTIVDRSSVSCCTFQTHVVAKIPSSCFGFGFEESWHVCDLATKKKRSRSMRVDGRLAGHTGGGGCLRGQDFSFQPSNPLNTSSLG